MKNNVTLTTLIIGLFCSLGTLAAAAVFGMTISFTTMGIVPYAVFSLLFGNIFLDIVLSFGIINTIKSIKMLKFVNTFENKHTKEFTLYQKLEQNQNKIALLTDLINTSNAPATKISLQNTLNAEKQMFNDTLAKIDKLTPKQQLALNKYIEIMKMQKSVLQNNLGVQELQEYEITPIPQLEKKEVKLKHTKCKLIEEALQNIKATTSPKHSQPTPALSTELEQG